MPPGPLTAPGLPNPIEMFVRDHHVVGPFQVLDADGVVVDLDANTLATFQVSENWDNQVLQDQVASISPTIDQGADTLTISFNAANMPLTNAIEYGDKAMYYYTLVLTLTGSAEIFSIRGRLIAKRTV